MTAAIKPITKNDLTLSFLTDGETADASDVIIPFQEVGDEIDEARQTMSVSANDTHNKHLEDALTVGSGLGLATLNEGANESLQITIDGATITGINAANLATGVVAAARGGLGADASAFSGLIEMSGGVASVATAETDYVTPGGVGTLANKTLTTPNIASFANATHDHEDAAGGGKLTEAAINSGAAVNGHVLTANGAGAASWAAVGGGGATPIDITVTAGEALAVRDFVFIDPATGTAKKTDADAVTPLLGAIRGVVNEAAGIANGATGSVRIAGEVSGFTGLTAWATVYAGTTPGGYTQTRPDPTDGGGQVAVAPMGYAVSATAVLVNPGRVTYLKRVTLANGAATTIVHHADPQGRTRGVSAHVATTDNSDITSYASSNQDEDVALALSAAGATTNNTTGTSTTTTRSALGDIGGTEYRQGQSFQLSAAGLLTQFTFQLGANIGSPTGNLTWRIHTDNSDAPGTVLITGTHTPTPSATNTIAVSDGPVLQASTKYWISLTAEAQPNDTRYTWACVDTDTNPYPDGGRATSNDGGSTWTSAPLQDMVFAVTTSAVVAKDKLAQSFEAGSSETVDKVRLWLKKTGAPSGTMTLRVETDSAGSPSGTLANANATVTLAESGLGTSYGWAEFDFTTNFALSASTPYWLVLSTDRAASSVNYVEWGADGSAPGYADGEMKSESSAVWNAESKDAVFEVLRNTTAYDEPCVVGRSSGGARDVGVRYDDGAGSDGNTKTTFSNEMGASADITVAVELE